MISPDAEPDLNFKAKTMDFYKKLIIDGPSYDIAVFTANHLIKSSAVAYNLSMPRPAARLKDFAAAPEPTGLEVAIAEMLQGNRITDPDLCKKMAAILDIDAAAFAKMPAVKQAEQAHKVQPRLYRAAVRLVLIKSKFGYTHYSAMLEDVYGNPSSKIQVLKSFGSGTLNLTAAGEHGFSVPMAELFARSYKTLSFEMAGLRSQNENHFAFDLSKSKIISKSCKPVKAA